MELIGPRRSLALYFVESLVVWGLGISTRSNIELGLSPLLTLNISKFHRSRTLSSLHFSSVVEHEVLFAKTFTVLPCKFQTTSIVPSYVTTSFLRSSHYIQYQALRAARRHCPSLPAAELGSRNPSEDYTIKLAALPSIAPIWNLTIVNYASKLVILLRLVSSYD
jgi:hypothetical protein